VSKRITIVLSDSANKKARKIQSKITAEVSTSVSFSKVVERLILVGMDHINIEKVIKELNEK